MTVSSIRKGVYLGLAICFLLSEVMWAAESTPQPNAASGKGRALFDMPAGKFFELKQAARPIDPAKIDHALLAAAIFHETNQRRGQENKQRLRHEARLDAASRTHADSMAEKKYLSHTNPDRPELKTPRDRARQAGYEALYIAENIATLFGIRYDEGKMMYPVHTPQGPGFSYQPDGAPIPRHTYRSFAVALLDQWMNSPGHRRNIVAEQPEAFGAGCTARQEKTGMDRFYCVQLFGASQR